jgi:proteasome lid subunit RPN8/RPN11
MRDLFKRAFVAQSKQMAAIKKATLEALLLAAKNTYPDEFIALLSSTKGKIIDEFVLLPATYGKDFSSIRFDLMPYDSNAKGSVHSHPGPYATPSKADLRAFRAMGEIHLIIAAPFNFQSARAFNASGKEEKIEVVE